MAPKGKQVGLEIRQLITKHRHDGKSIREISKLVDVPKSTVSDIISRFENENRLHYKSRKGQGRKLNTHDERSLLRKIKENPKLTAKQMSTDLSATLGTTVSDSTVRRTLKSNGIHGRIMRRKPFISVKNRKARLEYAKKYLSQPISTWNRYLFTDESKFNLNGSDGRTYVWRKTNQEFDKKFTRGTVKHGGGSIMVWGCMSSAGVGNLVIIDGTMTQYSYIDLLKDNLQPSAAKLGIENDYVFYQDNDPKHKAWNTKQWLLYNCPKVVETPAQSPDLNPMSICGTF